MRQLCKWACATIRSPHCLSPALPRMAGSAPCCVRAVRRLFPAALDAILGPQTLGARL